MSFARAVAALCLVRRHLRHAQAQVRCGPFTDAPIAAPQQHADLWAMPSPTASISRSRPCRTGRCTSATSSPSTGDPKVWAANMVPRGVLNAAVAGDRTEHLRWRLDHGNLDGPPPKGVVLLIGTNDLGHGRSPAEAAEGIRVTLSDLRDKLPEPASCCWVCGRAK